jgi:hypothetical protein
MERFFDGELDGLGLGRCESVFIVEAKKTDDLDGRIVHVAVVAQVRRVFKREYA